MERKAEYIPPIFNIEKYMDEFDKLKAELVKLREENEMLNIKHKYLIKLYKEKQERINELEEKIKDVLLIAENAPYKTIIEIDTIRYAKQLLTNKQG